MKRKNLNSFKAQSTLSVGNKKYTYYSLKALENSGLAIDKIPFCLKILLENLLRFEDGVSVKKEDILALANWNPQDKPSKEIAYTPARVILQDFTGVPAVADLGAMRDAVAQMGGDPNKINPLLPAELVIDHSVQIDSFGSHDSLEINAQKEFERNGERYSFLRWGQTAFKNFKVVPPDTGIVHQVNIEYLARVVFSSDTGEAYPDTVVGTDSHTTMVNGLGVLAWGVGGIEAEAAMLGQPIPLLIPQVIGFKLSGNLPEGTTATDLVLTITQMLRQKGVVGKFVEFFGSGLDSLTLSDRATISNMSPEFGSTCAIFPIDHKTIEYLKFTGRSEEQINLTKAYAERQGLYRTKNSPEPQFTSTLELNLADVVPSIAGPRHPHDRVLLKQAKQDFQKALPQILGSQKSANTIKTKINFNEFELSHGSVVIASITSCTNTSNPAVLIAAGLLAKKAVEKGLHVKPWVKTSLAPGSQVVPEYLKEAGVLSYLEKLKFHVVGFGCTTCIGNSGPLPEEISQAIQEGNLIAAAVLSGNRNFEGRINPHVRANYLASPPLVVAYALAGHMNWDPYQDPIGKDSKGRDVFLKDIWPTNDEIEKTMQKAVLPSMFRSKYAEVFKGDKRWQEIKTSQSQQYSWNNKSTYIQQPPFFSNMKKTPNALANISNARVLACLQDSVTTDHISPAGSIAKNSPAAKYLQENGVEVQDFNSYGSRRGNHEVMMRGTFANIRLKNQLVFGIEGGITRYLPSGEQTSIYEASLKYQQNNIPLIVIAGKEYGTGSSRDWAAKGTYMLGIKAVITQSFERIHRSNLIGMGILPLQFKEGETRESLGLTGEETYTITGIAEEMKAGSELTVKTNSGKEFKVISRIDTPVELEYYKHGGILQYVLRQLV